MKHSPERECNACGRRCFANVNYPCIECGGIFCTIITPLPGKRVSGVLCRDNEITEWADIVFFPGESLENVKINPCNTWVTRTGTEGDISTWTVEQWKERYGKLPRKGSKQMVIIELISNGK